MPACALGGHLPAAPGPDSIHLAYKDIACAQHRLQKGIKVVFNRKVWQWSLNDWETISIDGLQDLLAEFPHIKVAKTYQAFFTLDGTLCNMQDLSELLRSDQVELSLQDVRTMPPVDAKAHVQMLRQTADQLERIVDDQARVIQTFQQIMPDLPDPKPAPPEPDLLSGPPKMRTPLQLSSPRAHPNGWIEGHLASPHLTSPRQVQEQLCPRGHQLTRSVTPGTDRTCDNCSAIVAGGQQTMSCHHCCGTYAATALCSKRPASDCFRRSSWTSEAVSSAGSRRAPAS